ncbi:MAG: hypothetical protein Q8P05_00935 [Candidatus Diapherotrites archaeon]|nr:hypothetical protein [Candidatus Diapherotrites archaeon]
MPAHPSKRNIRPSRRPFHDPTPHFQTIDLGAGGARYALEQAARFPSRKYAAVDMRYRRDRNLSHIPTQTHPGSIRFFPVSIRHFLRTMIRHGWKTRHLNLDMPNAYFRNGKRVGRNHFEREIRNLFQNFPLVLIPNGKLFFTTESEEFMATIYRLAQEFGYSIREKKQMPFEHKRRKTAITQNLSGSPIYRVEITYNLKKAIPQKNVRRKWPTG